MDDDIMEEKAKNTIGLLRMGISKSKLVNSICRSYKEISKEMATKFQVRRKRISRETRKRILFEILCFAVFNVLDEARDFFERWRISSRASLDKQDIQNYKEMVTIYLNEHADARGFSSLRDPKVTSISPDFQVALGEPLNAIKRIGYYQELGCSEEALKYFSARIAYAIDLNAYPALTFIAMTHAEVISDIVRTVLNAVFPVPAGRSEA